MNAITLRVTYLTYQNQNQLFITKMEGLDGLSILAYANEIKNIFNAIQLGRNVILFIRMGVECIVAIMQGMKY
ncbi:unnamed protein product [Rhizophagus irregularis]|nr:unnamed protein product [Rhizophagus irregularis]